MGRPVVFDYLSPAEFLRDLAVYNRLNRRGFSLRSRSKNLKGCSPALITQVLKGQRKLKRDHLFNFTKIFILTPTEVHHIEALLKADQIGSQHHQVDWLPGEPKVRMPKNHLLSDWLNPYVKDLVELNDFNLDAKWMLKQLGFAAKLPKIEKSIEFLFREGFWRKTLLGKIVPDEAAVVTTNEIANEKIRAFHKQALKIAAKGLEDLPVHRRKASTILVAVNSETRDELKSLIDQFQNDLTKFIENHPKHKEELVQVTIHMTPVGGTHVSK